MNTHNTSTVCIIDGSAFLYRAYYALKPMYAPDGTPVNAVYGFCRILKKLLTQFHAEHVIVAWDSKGPTIRHELFAEYKAHRQAPPLDIHDQKKIIQAIIESLSIAQISVPGTEADDIIATIARTWPDEQAQIIIVSGDKDLTQLINEHIIMFDAFQERTIGIEQVQEKYGVTPSEMSLYLALMGDASDNIPGVAGIGPKAAQKLTAQYHTIEELYKNIESIEPKGVREKIRAGEHNARLSLQLVSLHTVPLSLKPQDTHIGTVNWHKARTIFEQLGFQSLLKEIGDAPVKPANESFITEIISTEEQLKTVCAELQRRGECAIDTEGICGTTPVSMELVGISLAFEEGRAYYIPIAHTTGEQQVTKAQITQHLTPLLEDPAIKKYLHHAKFDLIALQEFGIQLTGIAFDTLIAAHLTVHDGERIGLKALSRRYFQEEMTSFTDLLKTHGASTIAAVPIEAAARYAAADAHQTWRLVPLLQKTLAESEQSKLYTALEMPLINILARMERSGIALDTAALERDGAAIEKEIISVRDTIAALIGVDDPTTLNLNSPKQLETILFSTLKLTPVKKTAGKQGYSTDQEVLVELAKQHPVPGFLLTYRSLTKLKNTYIDALPKFILPKTGRIHTNFSQTSTATGRLASSDPNLQNIPTAHGYGMAIRSAFYAPEGCLFISADYSQIELRVLAHLSGDATLTDAFLHDKDIHALTASHLFETPLEQVTNEQRQIGKRINFSILYGLTPYGLSKDLGISHDQAKRYIETFLARYAGVEAWMRKIISFTKEHGYVVTEGGRRRVIPEIHERNKHRYDLACRIAVNTVAQGTAAEIMKRGMIAVDALLQKNEFDAKLLLQIHDELLLQVRNDDVERITNAVSIALDSVVQWNVPLRVSIRTGQNWGAVSK